MIHERSVRRLVAARTRGLRLVSRSVLAHAGALKPTEKRRQCEHCGVSVSSRWYDMHVACRCGLLASDIRNKGADNAPLATPDFFLRAASIWS